MLRLESATYRYAGASRPSLVDVSLELPAGTMTGLVGPSEAGKTTLCLVLGGLAPRTIRGVLTGALRIDGQDLTGRPMHELAALVGSGFQDPAQQLTHIADSVFEEVAFGPANLGLPRDDLLRAVGEALERTGIGHLAARDPRRLSGGQQQLVALAALLAMRPRALVLDEPTAHLDPCATRQVMDTLASLAADGLAVLVAEQKVAELARVCSNVVVLAEGRVVMEGPAAEVLADPRLAELGIEELPERRLARMARGAGLDPRLVEARA